MPTTIYMKNQERVWIINASPVSKSTDIIPLLLLTWYQKPGWAFWLTVRCLWWGRCW